MQNRLFPADVIFSSGTEWGQIVMIAPLMFLSLPTGAMLTDFIILSIPSARKDFEEELNGPKQGWRKSSMLFYRKMIIIFMLVLIPVSMVGFYNYFYITPAGITLRPMFSIKEKHYDWNDIVRIQVNCLKADNGYIWNYVVYMRDGENVDFLRPLDRKFIKVSDKVKPFIKAQKNIIYTYSLDTNGLLELRKYSPEYAEKLFKFISNKD